MRILMLGWEFPPFVAGGLGTACFGLTKALDRLGHDILFVLPKSAGESHDHHVTILGPDKLVQRAREVERSGQAEPVASAPDRSSGVDLPGVPASNVPGFSRMVVRGVPAAFTSPYPVFTPGPIDIQTLAASDPVRPQRSLEEILADVERQATSEALALAGVSGPIGSGSSTYGSDLIGDSHRYARLVLALTRYEQFDVIHAHDWLTYPAGLLMSRVTGRPLVVHVHATEFDRSGSHVNQQVYDIERAGMHGADRVIAVSMFTQSICVKRYGVPTPRVEVVYNGVEMESMQPKPGARLEADDKIVLFLGRITMQKGPEYFIAAAKRVLEKMDNVKFVVAGAGDMALRMIDMAAHMGIGSKVLFTGFLRGKDVERVFRMADCYVMPSVSEPFGIAALEAIQNDVPVIISKTSGVAEVLTHALKVDFWDIDEMANKIVAVLKFPPLSQTLRQHGSFELRRLTWDGAAERCVQVYDSVLAQRVATAP